MISFIVGQLESKEEGSVVIENNGIGYEILVSNNTLATLPLSGEMVKIFTYLVVKEDSLSLVGFSDIDEKNLFLKLISVSGIGPKMALCILSGLTISELILAISKSDSATISKVKSVGKKTAERIVLELKDKVSFIGSEMVLEQNDDLPTTAIEDATDVLVSLGLSKNEAYKLAKSNALAGDTAENIVAKTLKGM